MKTVQICSTLSKILLALNSDRHTLRTAIIFSDTRHVALSINKIITII